MFPNTGKLLEAFGEFKTLHQWAQDPRCTVCAAYLGVLMREGKTLEEAITWKTGKRQQKLEDPKTQLKKKMDKDWIKRFCEAGGSLTKLYLPNEEVVNRHEITPIVAKRGKGWEGKQAASIDEVRKQYWAERRKKEVAS